MNPAAEVPRKVRPTAPSACDLQARPSYQQGERVEMIFRIPNEDPTPLWVLRWNTPLEGLMGDCFEIQRERSGGQLPGADGQGGCRRLRSTS